MHDLVRLRLRNGVGAAITLLGACSFGEIDPPCDFDAEAQRLAGTSATNCGKFEEDPAEGTSCAELAFTEGRAFTLTWTSSGIDSMLTNAYAFDGVDLWILRADDYGGEDRVDGNLCVGPSFELAPSAGYELVCADSEPPGNHFQVCGTCDGCHPPGLPMPTGP